MHFLSSCLMRYVVERICSLPRDAGSCSVREADPVTRYYFDTATATCRSFQYSQCGGNDNNFRTLEQCHGFCLARKQPVIPKLRFDDFFFYISYNKEKV
ncbi:unnamed protein product [Gongylonema pulchrum]|uniref:BPTI/Kunitz inhibitor domain-containing protein n=1 Tax=Gongylonema pulchrum TaxID=637853 RepID=A0A183EV91_9BILA|nr:unnamed protein product [Gongylonema pulchrum]